MARFKFLLIFLSITVFSVSANADDIKSNNYCNFLLELGEGIDMDQTYTMSNVKFENLKLRHQKKVMAKLDLSALIQTTVNLNFFKMNLGNICRYKKNELQTIKIDKSDKGIILGLIYQPVPKNAKSKG